MPARSPSLRLCVKPFPVGVVKRLLHLGGKLDNCTSDIARTLELNDDIPDRKMPVRFEPACNLIIATAVLTRTSSSLSSRANCSAGSACFRTGRMFKPKIAKTRVCRSGAFRAEQNASIHSLLGSQHLWARVPRTQTASRFSSASSE